MQPCTYWHWTRTEILMLSLTHGALRHLSWIFEQDKRPTEASCCELSKQASFYICLAELRPSLRLLNFHRSYHFETACDLLDSISPELLRISQTLPCSSLSPFEADVVSLCLLVLNFSPSRPFAEKTCFWISHLRDLSISSSEKRYQESRTASSMDGVKVSLSLRLSILSYEWVSQWESLDAIHNAGQDCWAHPEIIHYCCILHS